MIKIVVDQLPDSFNLKKDKMLGPWCFNENLVLKNILKFKYKNLYLEDKIDEIKAFQCCENQHSVIIIQC
jgi:hypothetical protein